MGMGSLTGGGGLSSSAGGGGPSSAGSGGTSSAGGAIINIGGNPNVSGLLQSPWALGALVVVVIGVAVVWKRRA